MREVLSIEWVTVHEQLRETGFVRFEYLTAAHNGQAEFEVFSKLTTPDLSEAVLLKTTVTNEIESLASVFPTSTFHEREVRQLFGLHFAGHENMQNAFDVDFDGYPLRRDFALTTRATANWPGAVEPDEKARRRPSLPPGVHESWSNS